MKFNVNTYIDKLKQGNYWHKILADTVDKIGDNSLIQSWTMEYI